MQIHTFDNLDRAFACREAMMSDPRFPVDAQVSVFHGDREYIRCRSDASRFTESVRMRAAQVESPDWALLDRSGKPQHRWPCIIA